MSRGGLVIGLGGVGTRVVERVRQVLTASAENRPPDSIRLLAFDLRKPVPATGRLPQSYHFLVQVAPVEAPAGAPVRQVARAALLADLKQGVVNSSVLRALATQLDALSRAGVTQADVFLVSSSFGATGSAWLVDMAYLVRHLAGNRIKVRIHAILLTPEAFERAFFPSQAHRLTHYVVLRELELWQRERSWEQGASLYGGKPLGGLPGVLTRRPLDSVQVVEGQELNTAPEAGAIPLTAEGILCQLDPQASAVLEEAAQLAGVQGTQVFSTFGVFTLLYPGRIALEEAVQRLIIGTLDHWLPLEKDPNTGRPLRLAEPLHLRPDDPYGKLEFWITEPHHSGILQEVMRQADLLARRDQPARRAALQAMESRGLDEWKAIFFQCEGAEALLSQGNALPEPLQPLINRHGLVFLKEVARRVANPDPRLGAPFEYLRKLEQALAAYMQDLDSVLESWRERGESAENESLLRTLQETRRSWEQRRDSLLGRLMPQAAQDAQERYIQARQLQAQYKQRETILRGILDSASLMHSLTHQLLIFGERLVNALALISDSVYNMALDQSLRLEREKRFEAAIRVQQLVLDQGYETRRSRLVFDAFRQELTMQLALAIEELADRESPAVPNQTLPFRVADPAREGEKVALDDPALSAEQLAGLLMRVLTWHFTEALLASQPENSVLGFLHYLDPRADHLGNRLVASATPAVRLLTPIPARRNFLFAPSAGSAITSTYSQTLLGELQHHLGDVYVFQTENPERLTLFRYFDGLSLDHLLTFHQSEPPAGDLSPLRPFILWKI
ncbi:tubulin like protein [Anaerolinea thermolimosa]|uniref:tubulin-like doman-containing protein n=1 Tax=Anaerolinea thermolimosa TaxID=229919 RepID=UPI000783A5F4|nr:tubulin-like doman-containing protein [Anaerolinea thermolimosa]GAP08094.1 tubulin like protein [Anaerolinea thermolimosa]